MHCLSFWVYRLEGAERRRRYYLTSNPQLDATYWAQRGGGQVHVLTPPLSIARAEQLCDQLARVQEQPYQAERVLRRAWRRWRIAAELAEGGIVSPLSHWAGQGQAQRLWQLLRGRILLLGEVEQAVASQRLYFTHPLPDLLQFLCLEGKVQCRSAVAQQPRRCLRCGSDDLQPIACLECGDTASWTCQNCSNMGLAKSCTPLYASPDAAQEAPQSVDLQLPAALTPLQQQAAHALQEFLAQRRLSTCLFWAVCGAGKTETVLPAVQQVLAAGGRVLWATPRRDVVMELAPRLQQAFPAVGQAVLHGQSAQRFATAPLILATTHQALRLFAAFDLVILDEVDAFPYVDNPMLQLAVQRALRPEGKLIYLTATPTEELLQQVRRGQVQQVLLPLRWHGHPLPEPQLRLLRLPAPRQAEWRLPPQLIRLLDDSLEKDLCQVLVFVPSVRLAEQVGRSLQTHYAARGTADWVEYIHAADRQREHKRGRFFAGEFPILVTTTLMERGITLPRVNVIVLYADAQIFQAPVLMQIAGRAGRAAEYPQGKVYFLAQRRTRALAAACAQIRQLNRAAQQAAAAADKEANDNVES